MRKAALEEYGTDSEDDSESGSDDDSGSGSGSESDDGSDSESGSGSGSDDDNSNDDNSDDDNSDDDDSDDENDENSSTQDSSALKEQDVATIVQLCAQMDSSLNRIRGAYGKMGTGQDENLPPSRNNANTSPNTNGDNDRDHTQSAGGQGESGSQSSAPRPPMTPSTPHPSNDNRADGIDPSSSATPDLLNSSSVGRLSSHAASRPQTPADDWDRYSADSISGLPAAQGTSPHVVDPADLYRFNQGGVPIGGRVGDEKRAEMIKAAIEALMEDDD